MCHREWHHRQSKPARMFGAGHTETHLFQSILQKLNFLHSVGFLVLILCLTGRQFDFQGRADEGHQGGGEVDRVVVRDGHVHLHQSLKGIEAERRSHEVITNQNIPWKVSSLQNQTTGYLVELCVYVLSVYDCVSAQAHDEWLLLCCYEMFICWKLKNELAWNELCGQASISLLETRLRSQMNDLEVWEWSKKVLTTRHP